MTTTTKSGAQARHRKPITQPMNAVEKASRWWVITYGPATAAYYLSDRPRIVAASFAAIEVSEDGSSVAAFFTETGLEGRHPARCVRRITAECASIVGYDSWEEAVAVAYAAGGPQPEEEWDNDFPLARDDADDATGGLTAPAPLTGPADGLSDAAWVARLEADISAICALPDEVLPEGVIRLPVRQPSLWDDANPFTRPSTSPASSAPGEE